MNEVFTSYLNTIESEIKRALPAESNAAWVADVFGSEPQDLLPEHIAPLLQPTRALVDLGGKRWRPLLLVLTAEACLADRPKLSDAERKQLLADAFHLAPLVEFVHTASLIHDDIEDNSDTRRGKPAAYITYGTDTAINAASWLYFQAPVCIDTLSLPAEQKARLYALYAMELRRLHLGQAMDIAWHRTPAFLPREGQYLTMVMHKTGTLASLAAKTGMLAAGAGEAQAAEAGQLAARIGAGFQIIDDVINLTAGNPGKKRGDDIVEGKKSLPVLLFAQQYGTDSKELAQLTDCFAQARQEGISSPAVEKAVSLLTESGAVSRAQEKGSRLITEGCSAFAALFSSGNIPATNINTLFTSLIPVIL